MPTSGVPSGLMVPEYDLSGKVAVITGAGRGIGTGIAEVFAEAGAVVVVNARTAAYAQPFAEALTKRTATPVLAVAADVTSPSGAADLLAQTLARFGRVDILVNNLGDAIRKSLVALPEMPSLGRPVDLESASDADVQTVLDINLLSTLHCTRAFGPQLLEQRSGKVINIASFASFRGLAHNTLYAAAKTGLVGLTRSLALEWAMYGVQVNCIAPGIFPDPVTIGDDGHRRAMEDATSGVPQGRVGELREVGLLALYLASAASDYMTGQVICLDGGLTA